MGDSLENTDTSVETQNVAIVDYGEFANYIRKAATILLPEEDATAPDLNAVLDDKFNQDCIKKFLSDPQVQALYIQRTCSKGRPPRHLSDRELCTIVHEEKNVSHLHAQWNCCWKYWNGLSFFLFFY